MSTYPQCIKACSLTAQEPPVRVIIRRIPHYHCHDHLCRFSRWPHHRLRPEALYPLHCPARGDGRVEVYRLKALFRGIHHTLWVYARNLITIWQFVALHDSLNDPGTLPPKRILATTFVPSAWLDETLVAERKAGLSAYLTGLLESPQFRNHQSLIDFLTPSSTSSSREFNPEDAIPSTLSRKTALNLAVDLHGDVSAEATTPIAAAYYPDWAADSNPPNKLDFSKFDILYFGTSAHSPHRT